MVCATDIFRNSHKHVLLMCIFNRLRMTHIFIQFNVLYYIGPVTDKATKTHQFTIIPCNFHCNWRCSLYPSTNKIAIKVRLSASEWNRSDLIFAYRLPEINVRRYTWRCFHLYAILFCKLNGIVSRMVHSRMGLLQFLMCFSLCQLVYRLSAV